ncbi:putative reverse transcriptase domain-containing protein [Tanacetum coccineum]|uniref:Reverse transcriptase domain-containing protein n=1 Tax=Tanacetum coccineum TaxID=301880 RepID=A0ABQ4WWS6_9ASTR
MAAYEATRAVNALKTESQSQNGSDGDNGNGGNGNDGDGNGGDGNGGNGNGRNGNPNENNRGARPVARECTYQDFMKCQPLNFKGTKGVVGLIRWFEKMETVFHISNCPKEIPNNDLAAYTQRFQELTMLCTKMVPEEEDQVEKFIGGKDTQSDCPKLKESKKKNRGTKPETRLVLVEASGKAYVLGVGDANPDSNVVTGLLGHPFNIDLMPVELGSFDVIIGMDWLANHHAVIVCDEKIVRIPYGDEVLIVQGDRSGKGKKSLLKLL